MIQRPPQRVLRISNTSQSPRAIAVKMDGMPVICEITSSEFARPVSLNDLRLITRIVDNLNGPGFHDEEFHRAVTGMDQDLAIFVAPASGLDALPLVLDLSSPRTGKATERSVFSAMVDALVLLSPDFPRVHAPIPTSLASYSPCWRKLIENETGTHNNPVTLAMRR